jgi:5-methylthioribose kinase
MVRRLVGIAHVADMNTIEDPGVRAGCERRALQFGRSLLVNPQTYEDITSIRDLAVAAAAAQ